MDPLARADVRRALPTAGERALAARPESATPAQAAQQFEALLIGELLKRAQQPMFAEAPLAGGSAGAMYRDLFADEVAARMAAAGGLGLADALGARAAAPEAKP